MGGSQRRKTVAERDDRFGAVEFRADGQFDGVLLGEAAQPGEPVHQARGRVILDVERQGSFRVSGYPIQDIQVPSSRRA
jgi:hypothetical protein